jgi:hypothetical protein
MQLSSRRFLRILWETVQRSRSGSRLALVCRMYEQDFGRISDNVSNRKPPQNIEGASFSLRLLL